MKKLVLLMLIFAAAPALSITGPAVGCEELVESFCKKLFEPPNRGNFDIISTDLYEKIRLGKTSNDIYYSRYFFYEAIDKYFNRFPKDMRKAMAKTDFITALRKTIYRKKLSEFQLADLYKPEWISDTFTKLKEVMAQVALTRMEKKFPGYLKKPGEDISADEAREYGRVLETAWSELFKAIWETHPSWIRTQALFEKVREEYLNWVNTTDWIGPNLKATWKKELQTLRLVIPGSHPKKANPDNGHWCGIDENNAYYTPPDHELTICAGDFIGVNPLQTLAHETGHALGIGRRMIRHIEDSPLGLTLAKLWRISTNNELLTCSQWGGLKKEIEHSLANLKPYVFEDNEILKKFIWRDLSPFPKGADLTNTAERFARFTVRGEIDGRFLETIIKKEETLLSGRRLPNTRYLQPHKLSAWPVFLESVDRVDWHFELFTVQEFNCNANEKKMGDPVALEQAILEARRLATLSWKAMLQLMGPYAYYQDALDDGISQDIEEDVVDFYASSVVSRLLGKIEPLKTRQSTYLATVAGYCDPPSFINRYPEETAVLQKFTNGSHSVGLARRLKLLTPEVRASLRCL
jgi:hypothetical protein